MHGNTSGTFFRQWLRNPREMGAISPSSASLARAMVAEVGDVANGTVIELGAGTGVITQALVEAGLHPWQLVLVEKNARMASALRRRFIGTRVLEADATRLSQIARRHGISDIRVIVSALPLLLLDRRRQYAMFEQAFRVLAPGGAFLQFTYGLGKPVPDRVLQRLGLRARRAGLVWRNVPPATVWRFECATSSKRQAGERLAPPVARASLGS